MRFLQARFSSWVAGAILLLFVSCSDDSPTGPDGGGGGNTGLSFDTFQAADVVIGQPDMSSGDINAGGITNAAGMRFPYGSLGEGSLYVPDQINHRVLGFTSIPSTNGSTADFVIGQNDFTSNTSGTSASALDQPVDCVVSDGKLFLVDLRNHRILIWNTLPTSNVPADVVVGQGDFTSSTPGLSQTALDNPLQIFVAGGQLFLSDFVNNRVLIWNNIPTVNNAPADVVLGQTDFVSKETGLSVTTFGSPRGIWVGGNKLVVGDGLNDRVLIWNSIPTTNGAAADIVVGAPDFNTAGSDVPSATSIGRPIGVTSDGDNLYVTDFVFHRVLIYPFPTTNGASATVVLGQSNFTLSAGNDPNQDGVSEGVVSAKTFGTGFISPSGVRIIGRQLFVTDQTNNRYLIFNSK